MNLPYLFLRLVRHFLPEKLTRFLLRRNWIIHPGMESSDPQRAVEQYCRVLNAAGQSLSGRRVLVFGYGGRFDIGVKLLRAGAEHVILCDKFAPPDHRYNVNLLPTARDYLFEDKGKALPDPEWITLYQGDIRDAVNSRIFPPADLVLSSSVFEHLPYEELDSITAALAAMTASGGGHIHFVDLRDHFFKYPFEMLTFSSSFWKHWLNPTSNLNRLRLPDYQQLFDAHFKNVNIAILASDPVAFERVQGRVRPEFLTNDPRVQAATLIQISAGL